ncbi:prolyl endopeptidase-like [Planococcus citri]|uniref:prolyl endopeptidase-like n=1 Tax=Planococcus citri TaxID=170843 RepID=UPI0031F98B23
MVRKLLLSTKFLAILAIVINCAFCQGRVAGESVAKINSLNYPNPRRDENVFDTYPKNTTIKDPYRWMENLDSEETKKLIEEENSLTKSYLSKSPFRAELEVRLKELYNFHRFIAFFQKGKRFFSYQNNGLQNQDVVSMHDSLTSDGTVFLDPNILSEDGTVSFDPMSAAFSEDGLIFAYLLLANGSDWKTLHFKHVEQGDIYEEILYNVKFTSLLWTHDNKGLFYAAYSNQKNESERLKVNGEKNMKLYYHLLGTEQSEDVVAVEFPNNSDYLIDGWISDCGKYLIVTASPGSDNNLIYIADLNKINYQIKGNLELVPIVTKMEATFEYIANYNHTFIFKTNKDASNNKLITIDIENPDPKTWKNLVPEDEKYALESAKAAFNKYLTLSYIQDVKSVLQLHDLKTGNFIKKFDLEIGAINKLYIFTEQKSPSLFFTFESFFTPGIIYHLNLSAPSFNLEVVRENKLKNFDREKFAAEQVFYKSKDGTQIPMYLLYKKGLQKNGNNPSLLYGYGGYAASLLPYFSIDTILWISNFDGVYANANIRGGGEYGEKWHRDGILDKKQNSFDDFQAAAEYLIAKNYTKTDLLTINGISNGGLLMGACLNQRPDLFSVVVSEVSVLDTLGFERQPDGYTWVPEYGSPSNEKDFEYLYKTSPLHNIKIPNDPNKQYPAVMLTTADHDDRVPPYYSLKFISTLRYEAKNHPNQKNPFIIRIEKNAGHSLGEPTEKLIARYVDQYCFIIMNTGSKFHT